MIRIPLERTVILSIHDTITIAVVIAKIWVHVTICVSRQCTQIAISGLIDIEHAVVVAILVECVDRTISIRIRKSRQRHERRIHSFTSLRRLRTSTLLSHAISRFDTVPYTIAVAVGCIPPHIHHRFVDIKQAIPISIATGRQIAFTCITYSIAVHVQLSGVGSTWTLILPIAHKITIHIDVTDIAQHIAIHILLHRILHKVTIIPKI
ncbi:hypothetical protein SCE1572_52095 [Sorangium cellulosum So0157-2]|uniref:Uncharacterized protein n=1 Tax=Sorangium cellulosum So0157-2 TaxID=1254432 RepID=S4Y9U9_SORCE|nr:hypothetical protein SCE1572_52095 [Sorangium cellulosum So0157-2]